MQIINHKIISNTKNTSNQSTPTFKGYYQKFDADQLQKALRKDLKSSGFKDLINNEVKKFSDNLFDMLADNDLIKKAKNANDNEINLTMKLSKTRGLTDLQVSAKGNQISEKNQCKEFRLMSLDSMLTQLREHLFQLLN